MVLTEKNHRPVDDERLCASIGCYAVSCLGLGEWGLSDDQVCGFGGALLEFREQGQIDGKIEEVPVDDLRMMAHQIIARLDMPETHETATV